MNRELFSRSTILQWSRPSKVAPNEEQHAHTKMIKIPFFRFFIYKHDPNHPRSTRSPPSAEWTNESISWRMEAQWNA